MLFAVFDDVLPDGGADAAEQAQRGDVGGVHVDLKIRRSRRELFCCDWMRHEAHKRHRKERDDQ